MAVQVQTSLDSFVPSALLAALTDEMRSNLALSIASIVETRWRALAAEKLTTALTKYTQSIQQAHLEGQAAVVTLLGDDANRTEHGVAAYDMRSTLVGPNVPVVTRGSGQRGKQVLKGGGGYYRAIPFRHQTPGKGSGPKAMRLGKPMGHADSSNMGADAARAMGKAVHAAAKKLTPTLSEPHRLKGQKTAGSHARPGNPAKLAPMHRVTWGTHLPSGVGGAQKLRPHHKTDIYAGMYKMQETYQKATQNTYMTFRTISTRNSVGWQHPATPGVQIMKQLQDELPVIAKEFIDHFLASAQGAP